MALERGARSLVRNIQCQRHDRLLARPFTSCAQLRQPDLQSEPPAEPPPPLNAPGKKYDPNTVTSPRGERRLLRRQRIMPVGSRRRRAAIASLQGQNAALIPFEQLPYQCFQEARKFLQEDREEKLGQIKAQKGKIEKFKAQAIAPQDENHRERSLHKLEERMEKLKVWADINDPLVKKTYEDGMGDMNKPIYRYLADRDWRSYKRRLVMQRVTQMNVVPDVLPQVDPTVSTVVAFRGRKVLPGEFVDSRVSETPPTLKIQTYEKGEKLVTIAVVNADVPDVERDGFTYRCHFLASNIKISPTVGNVPLDALEPANQVLLDWLPAYAQKGAPYQRMGIFIFEQRNGPIDVEGIKESGHYTDRRKLKRDKFNLRGFKDYFGLNPIGVDLFRTQWDEGTAGVMQRAGIGGWDIEFKRKRIEPLPYKKLDGARYR